jgi:Fe-S oxidoreductase
MNARWTLEEEKKLIKAVKHGEKIDSLAKAFNRSENALELRIKKIIYDTISEKRSLKSIAKSLNFTEDKVKQYFYSYKDMMEKKGKKTIDIVDDDKDKDKDKKKDKELEREKKRTYHKPAKLERIKKQNDKMMVILKHIELKKEHKKAIKSNKFSDNEIKMIKSIF